VGPAADLSAPGASICSGADVRQLDGRNRLRSPGSQHLVSKTVSLSDQAASLSDDQSHALVADAAGSDDDSTGYADSGEDFSTHAGIGDEPVLMQSLAMVPQTSRLAPALRSDAALQPPFLPRAGRPPRA